MESLLYWVLLSGSYFALVWGLASVLPERTYSLLRWLHWCTSGLCLLAVGFPVCTLGDWTFYSLGLFCLLLLASGLLAGIRARLKLMRASILGRVQAVFIGLAVPFLLLLSSVDSSSDIAYADGDFTVTVSTHSSLLRYDQNYPEVKLYRTHWFLFKEYLGNIGLNLGSGGVPELRTWWQGVSALTFEESSNHGLARRGGLNIPFDVNPSVLRQGTQQRAQSASAPHLPPPAADTRVYTYVEEMPRVLGSSSDIRLVLARIIQRQLVLPPAARNGQVSLQLDVTKTGEVQNLRVLQGLSASVDSAVLTAAHHLPFLLPGRQDGQPVNVELTLPIILAPSPRAQQDSPGGQ